MSCLRRPSADMKGLSAPLYFAIRVGHSFVLAQMLGPRFSYKDFYVSLRVRSVTKQVPTNRAVTLTYSFHFFHHSQELFSSLGIDSIFNRGNRRPFSRLRINQHYRLRPVHRRRER